MRVISGVRKGHKLVAPKTYKTRPTDSKVKESIFNILGYIDTESIVLDLFAGSGAIGIEFLSRGASKCFFIDKSDLSIGAIRKNLNHTKFEDRAEVWKLDAIKAIDRLSRQKIKFDYIYLDPPFDKSELLVNILEKIKEKDILEEDGNIIVEHGKPIEDFLDYSLLKSKKYGSKYVSFLKQ